MADGDGRFLLAKTRNETMILGREIGLPPSGRVSRLGTAHAQPRASLPRLATLALARAFIISRTHTCPTGQMPGGWKPTHVGADFCQHDLGAPPADSGNRVQQGDLFFKRAHAIRDLSTDFLDE